MHACKARTCTNHTAACVRKVSLPMKPLTGLRERTESSRNTVLGLCFLTPRTVVGFCLRTLSKSSMIFSWCLLSYSSLVKSPLRWGVPSAGGVRDAGGVPGVCGLSSLLSPQPSMIIHWGLLQLKGDDVSVKLEPACLIHLQ